MAYLNRDSALIHKDSLSDHIDFLLNDQSIMSFPPNLFLIGAQKAGTTFLANLLGQHADICVSYPKETAYFTRNFGKGLNWYKAKYSELDAKYLLDATTGYSISPLPDVDCCTAENPQWGVPEKIRQVSVRIVVEIGTDTFRACHQISM